MNAKKRILILADTFDEYCQSTILKGIMQASKGSNVDIITLPLAFQGKIDAIQTHYFFIKEYLNNSFFDVIIAFTGGLTEHTSEVTLKALFTHTTLPVISVAGALKRDCDIMINNKPGIIDIMDHFIATHQVKQIAYIGGPRSNKEAKERLSAYKEGLQKNSLEYQENLVFTGNYSEESGAKAVDLLLQSGASFDAIVCADDYTALGALNELVRRDFSVPNRVKISGFDDIEEAYLSSPSLTTVQQPFTAMGKKAFNVATDILEKKHVDKNILLNTEAVFRESCSCDTSEIDSVFKHVEMVHTALNNVKRCTEEIFFSIISPSIEDIAEQYNYKDIAEKEGYQNFLQMHCAFIWNNYVLAENNSDNCSSFLHTFTGILNNQAEYEENYEIWEFVLLVFSIITERFEERSPKAEALNEMLIEARAIYENHLLKSTLSKQAFHNNTSTTFREALAHIVNCRTHKELIRTLRVEHKQLPFAFLSIALYETPTQGAFTEQSVVHYSINSDDVSGICFQAKELLPSGVAETIPQNCIWLPLAFRQTYYGYLIISVDDEYSPFFYEELRGHISLSLAMQE